MSAYEATRERVARAIRGNAFAEQGEVPHAFYEMADRALAALAGDGFYKAFTAEMEALVIGASDSAVSVVGECTRAAKRAEMMLTEPDYEARRETARTASGQESAR